MSQESTVKLPPYNRNLILEVVLLYKCTQFNYVKIHHLLLCNALKGKLGMAGHKSSFSCAKQLNQIWIRSLLFRGQIKFWSDPLLSLSWWNMPINSDFIQKYQNQLMLTSPMFSKVSKLVRRSAATWPLHKGKFLFHLHALKAIPPCLNLDIFTIKFLMPCQPLPTSQ